MGWVRVTGRVQVPLTSAVTSQAREEKQMAGRGQEQLPDGTAVQSLHSLELYPGFVSMAMG